MLWRKAAQFGSDPISDLTLGLELTPILPVSRENWEEESSTTMDRFHIWRFLNCVKQLSPVTMWQTCSLYVLVN